MECEKCGTWNPDDKVRCWRCNAELPKPPEPRKSTKISSQTWMWIIVALFIIVTTLFRCNAFDLGGGDSTGSLPPISVPGHVGLDGGLAMASRSGWAERLLVSPLPISVGYSTIESTL